MMKKCRKKQLLKGLIFLVAFAIWTALVRWVDVRPIGPQGSSVGLASWNALVRDAVGVRHWLYVATDWLGLLPVGIVFCFAVQGLLQWCRRRSLRRVDRGLLLLGGFYLAVMAVYVGFELFPMNVRPVLINGVLEASYPSSTTVLGLTVIPSAMIRLRGRVKSAVLWNAMQWGGGLLVLLLVLGRLFSGVHWCSDIVGGCLISAGLVLLYAAFSNDAI